MSSPRQSNPHSVEFVKIAETVEDLALLRQHVKDIVEGAAFKGSHRSGQFLQYIIDQGVAGHFDSIKERVIGVELFGRSPTYDTGEDAIVRVTASDVRKRLLQHYGRYGNESPFRISLPLGSYIPEIVRDPQPGPKHTEPATSEVALPSSNGLPVIATPEPTPHEPSSTPETQPAASVEEQLARRPARWWLYAALALTVLNIGVWIFFWNRNVPGAQDPRRVLPWSALLDSPRPLQLITSDPDIAEIQGYTGQVITISDYANHNYIPHPEQLTPETTQICRILLGGNKAALVDTPIAVGVTELAQASSRRVEVHAARSIQLSNLQTDDNFVLLGSPRSNPWITLFSDQMSFRFSYDKASSQEIILNVHPGPHEKPQYVPTALGWATGQSYAILAMVRNPDQNGNVLLLSGANAEGTEAAGKLVTDLPRLTAAFKTCGITPGGPVHHFELLLRLNMMAGSPTNVNVEACHVLPETDGH
ncbi:hypothetical protein [Edaphobacter modestus]|uniref:Uncharacterized protein n=1 Tax=Edaphobacter modestus TaxID=388466 RepID=A0A4Q7YF88_9BACT|nr:hypothetical protein [Edaphobacter modestus]RZU35424.1 hypothetical protein BDD14_5471 [Edaphobacter modestus]